MRWAIEVYFKEANQHLGFLKEQSNHYTATIASMRQKLCSNRTDISYAGKLWQVFRAEVSGVLDELKAALGDAVTLDMETIGAHIQCQFVQACLAT